MTARIVIPGVEVQITGSHQANAPEASDDPRATFYRDVDQATIRAFNRAIYQVAAEAEALADGMDNAARAQGRSPAGWDIVVDVEAASIRVSWTDARNPTHRRDAIHLLRLAASRHVTVN